MARPRLLAMLFICVGLAVGGRARAQGQEFPPPSGKGRIVVVASGMSGPEHYATIARAIAALGYDVVLFDGSAMEGTHGQALLSAIQEAQGAPHGLPGKVALVGFSAGGGIVLFFGSQHPELANGVVVWYPATAVIKDIGGFASRIQLPVVMFAGGADTFRNGCCLASTAQTIAQAAKAAGKSFDLTIYPGVEHDFVQGGSHYAPRAYNDAFQKTAAALRGYFAR